MRRSIVFLSIMLLAASFDLLAKDFWERPLSQWSSQEVQKLLFDSPWATQMTLAAPSMDKAGYSEDMSAPSGGQGGAVGGGASPRDITAPTRGYGADKSSGVSGEKELYDRYTVRFFTAPVIRQAYVRWLQLMKGYDSMNPEQKKALDGITANALAMTFPDQVIIGLEFESNNRQLAMEVSRQLKQITKDQLKQKAYLITDRLGRIEIADYYPPSPDGTGAKFVFPRQVNGSPILTAEDKEIRLELFVPGTTAMTKDGNGHKVFVKWKVSKMMVNKELMY